MTDVANTTEAVNKKTTNDANEAKAGHQITSTSENANDKQLQPKQPTQVHQSTKDDTAVAKITKSLKVTGNSSKCRKSH